MNSNRQEDDPTRPLLASSSPRQTERGRPRDEPHENHAWHGRHVYEHYYPEDYLGYRGCSSWPFAFWLFLFGWLFPVLWFCGTFLLFSRNPFERNWARICGMALLLSILVGIFWGIADAQARALH